MSDRELLKGIYSMAKEQEIKVEEAVEEVVDAEVVYAEAEEVMDAEVEAAEEKAPTLEEILAAKEAEVVAANDRYQRTMAEFDNFRKRTIKEKSQMYESGAKEILDKLLPVIDNFERAFDAATDDHKEDPFVKGIDMIYKQVMAMLDDLGVEEIEALNKPFDPDLHHAVQHEASEDHDENMVVDVYQKGYMYKDTVLRYSMVKVVN